MNVHREQVNIVMPGAVLPGMLGIPQDAAAIVLFAHGSGSSRHSPRNQYVACRLTQEGLATLLFDLMTPEDELADERSGGRLRFDIDFLAERLAGAVDWVARRRDAASWPIGLFGASAGAAAALVTATQRADQIAAVVSRGGRPDLADEALPRVAAPTLLIVGGEDHMVST